MSMSPLLSLKFSLNAAHQTNVNGVWIRPHQARAVPVGSVFKLGGSTREFKVKSYVALSADPFHLQWAVCRLEAPTIWAATVVYPPSF